MPFKLGKLGANRPRYAKYPSISQRPQPSGESVKPFVADSSDVLRVIMSDSLDEIEKLVLQKFLSVNSEIGQKSLLAIALENSAYNVANFLVALNADINYLYPSKTHSLLSYHSQEGNERAVEFLLTRQAQVNDKRLSANTSSLFHAVNNQHTRVVQLLVDAGADVNIKVGNKPIVEWAAHVWFTQGIDLSEIVKILKNAGAKPS
jgi:ankyrin repeat protein